MKSEEINQLLKRYWQCETSTEEEQTLQSFFSQETLPEEWKVYQPLFAWKSKQGDIKAGKQLKKQIQRPVTVQFYTLIRVAASVLLMLSVGIGFYTHYEQEKYMEKVFSETYSDPNDAMKEAQEALGKVSLSLMKAQNTVMQEEVADSIQNEKMEEMNK